VINHISAAVKSGGNKIGIRFDKMKDRIK
jgi:hypothetical protein